MNPEISVLILTAASIGLFHTLFGPDHYLPFIVMSKARNWSMWKTTWVTTLCGLGHVAGSIALGAIGIAFGIGLGKLTFFESVRGDMAAWAFIAFGLLYMVWGIYKARRKHGHTHLFSNVHSHADNEEEKGKVDRKNLTPWVLFVIFVLGPCEPLIPVLMYPAMESSYSGVWLVSLVFGVVTIATMLSVVLISTFGLKAMPFGRMERYTHAIAGGTILLSGCAIVFLGL